MRLIALLPIFLLLVACGTEKKAMKAFSLGKYQTAIDLYRKLLADNPRDGQVNYLVAESYRLSNRIKEAESYYVNASGRGVNKDSVQFYYAQALKSNGKYEEARRQLDELIRNASTDLVRDRASAELDGLTYLERLNTSENFYRVKNLELINTPSAEYSPAYLNNELYFSSNRGNGKIYEATGTPYSDLYKAATQGANVDAATVAPLQHPINDPMRNEGCITFSPDGRIMVFAKGNTNKKNGGDDVDLYLVRFRNDSWTEPVKVNAPVNVQYRGAEAVALDKNYGWDSTPAFSPDGRTLYFASNRKDRSAQGGTDIYTA
ncbi:MAG TPA: tetratricopeptide repeat protein, partial [Cyclobacteriaceae bacterium]